MAPLPYEIGETLSVKIPSAPQTYSGIVYYSDASILVLSDKEAWHILKTPGIKVLPSPRKVMGKIPELPILTMDMIRVRENGLAHQKTYQFSSW
jgi:hypothetical protein